MDAGLGEVSDDAMHRSYIYRCPFVIVSFSLLHSCVQPEVIL